MSDTANAWRPKAEPPAVPGVYELEVYAPMTDEIVVRRAVWSGAQWMGYDQHMKLSALDPWVMYFGWRESR